MRVVAVAYRWDMATRPSTSPTFFAMPRQRIVPANCVADSRSSGPTISARKVSGGRFDAEPPLPGL